MIGELQAYEQTGADPVLCLVDPCEISLELVGEHVIPQLSGAGSLSREMGAAPPR